MDLKLSIIHRLSAPDILTRYLIVSTIPISPQKSQSLIFDSNLNFNFGVHITMACHVRYFLEQVGKSVFIQYSIEIGHCCAKKLEVLKKWGAFQLQ